MFAHNFTHSRSPSPSSSEDGHAGGGLAGTKLAPLRGSAIGDLKEYLAADAAAAKEDERKLKKAQWRARNGLGLQEGVSADVLLQGRYKDEKGKEKEERNKRNQDYVKVMQRMKKDEAPAQ